jgi:hypothetical protein
MIRFAQDAFIFRECSYFTVHVDQVCTLIEVGEGRWCLGVGISKDLFRSFASASSRVPFFLWCGNTLVLIPNGIGVLPAT